ncbi:tRNA (adenosine(37)-N6)-threonylcarbamoyltransferase complex dimerization subunit type 1 TsaB [Frankia sp. Cas4]|uniref:tRNA (adenosine(37)-N6)-threonylcarbamoyltransferase complex dimerization subunit type 1 TsaB n=1 Tax=Frankia sp. Cas4 TaxID=3073927 RepID=UPI002AD3E86E|nr:tRNA (adenosine(37)-N6)-threonylcarbamoyltransferase complex dimerization subunit type 1 TsaB [Frankia sp. Cas4]
MLLLAVDTATPACSVALVDVHRGQPAAGSASVATAAGVPAAEVPAAGGMAVESMAVEGMTGRAQRRVVDPRKHAELLVPLIREVLDEASARPGDLDAVVVGIGPGPFTSLRVGVMTAEAFADALGLPAYGVCSLDGVGADTSGRVAVATDARRREVYWAVYHNGERVDGPSVGRPQVVVDELRRMSVHRAVGPGLHLYPDVFADFADLADLAEPADPGYPSPVTLARLAGAAVLANRPPAPLVPLYLRRPDAAQPRPPKAVAR